MKDRRLLSILAGALLLRLYVAAVSAYVWDEDRDWIPVAEGISLDPPHLPVREGQHGSLPAYFIRAGAGLVGHNPIGFRLFAVLAGTLSVLVCARLAAEWAGPQAALWTAALVGFNEYHVGISALAVEKSFYLLFCALALLALTRALRADEPRALVGAAAACGCAFLCKEIAILLVAALLLGLLAAGRGAWLGRREAALSLLVFLAVISPDLAWNVRHLTGQTPATSYRDHLARIGGIGLTPVPLIFFGRDAAAAAYRLAGSALVDPVEEYPAMNPIGGGLLLVAVVSATLRRRADAVMKALLIVFWVVLCFFLLVRPSPHARADLDTDVWFWVDLVLLPAAALAGAWLAGLPAGWRRLVRGVAVVGATWAVLAAVALRLGLPAAAVAFVPPSLGAADGRLAEVEARFSFCALCPRNAGPTLSEITVESPGSPTASAVASADGRRLRLPADPGVVYRPIYLFRFLGRTDRMGRDVVSAADSPPPLPFWARGTRR